jgi:ApaG protein
MPEVKKYSVAVTAQSTYLPDQSDEEEDRYVFAYTIRITNNGNVPAQLVSRHWIITDADNQVQEVRGMGVVGEQPVLKPGDTFEYSSGSSIPTAVGTMRSYQLVAGTVALRCWSGIHAERPARPALSRASARRRFSSTISETSTRRSRRRSPMPQQSRGRPRTRTRLSVIACVLLLAACASPPETKPPAMACPAPPEIPVCPPPSRRRPSLRLPWSSSAASRARGAE